MARPINAYVGKGRQTGTTKATPKRAQELRRQGLTVLKIANALNVSHRSVFNYLPPPTG